MQEGTRLIAEAKQAGVEFRPDTLVWGAFHSENHIEITTLHQGVSQILKPESLVIATGAYEAPPLFHGWTLPGVMTTGALQTALRSYGTFPQEPILVAGNGPLNFQVALELAEAGATVIGVVEAAEAPWTRPQAAAALVKAHPQLALAGLGLIAKLRAKGIAIHWGQRIVSASGEDALKSMTLASVKNPSHTRSVSVGVLAHGDGFLPASELARLLGCAHDMRAGRATPQVRRQADGSTSRPRIFVVGEAGGFGGAFIAQAQGDLAGAAIARLHGKGTGPDPAALARLKRHQRFQEALWTLFAAPSPLLANVPDETILCRCEALSLGHLKAIVTEHDVRDVATLKRLSRAGMGRCQARYCGHHLPALVYQETNSEKQFLTPQVPVRPVPLSALALEKPEWAGHKRALLPPAGQDKATGHTIRETTTLVIGAGIAGLSTALYLAEQGHEVMVVDRGFPNASASGGNAGSLHAQLLSFDFGAKAEAGGSPALKTLPLQRDSIALWQALQERSTLDFEMKITGGLMVAETEKDLAFLHEKTRLERSQGIPCEVISANALREREPALHEGFIAAAFCPLEGKINPLIATQGVLDLAKAAGATILPQCEVLAITRERSGFRVITSQGQIKAARIVNAAGAFASRIGAMLNLSVPVFGAPLQMIVTEPAEPLVSCLVAHADRHLTLKQAGNGNFIIGGGWTAGLDKVHQHPRPLRPSLEGNLWIAQHVIPDLRKLMVLRSWAAMNINIDGAPIVGEHPAMPSFYTAVTSNGYTLGPMMGHLTANLILHGDAGRDIAPFGIDRFE